MRKLETAVDGRRFAIDTLRALADAGPERCRANLPRYLTNQADALMVALLELKERGTVESVIGFAQVVTDALGARIGLPEPQLYHDMERRRAFGRYKLRRSMNRGATLTALALWREEETKPPQ